MDKKEITAVLKSEGLDIAEDLAIEATRAAIKLLKVVLPKVSKGFGLVFTMFVDAYEDKIFEILDKIDGEKDI